MYSGSRSHWKATCFRNPKYHRHIKVGTGLAPVLLPNTFKTRFLSGVEGSGQISYISGLCGKVKLSDIRSVLMSLKQSL